MKKFSKVDKEREKYELWKRRAQLPCRHANQGMCDGCPMNPRTKELLKKFAP